MDGLSYTYFAYGDLRLSSKQFDGKLTATVRVTNTGEVPGKEVVQLYVSAPAQKLRKPEGELKGFAKTELLQPGQSQTLSFTVTAADPASFDSSSSAWIAEAGAYTVKVGASSGCSARVALNGPISGLRWQVCFRMEDLATYFGASRINRERKEEENIYDR
ncbi:MAG TPA: fibronectin type III-like domain-contianing protein [Blastocatellia bacterium]|nr:fibronectin type III-like domain-contianing protein [Blastocatellia bacterium]